MATSAGKGTDGSGVAEGSHMVGTSTGILRAEEEVVKEHKQESDSVINHECIVVQQDWTFDFFFFSSLSFPKSIFNLVGVVCFGWSPLSQLSSTPSLNQPGVLKGRISARLLH